MGLGEGRRGEGMFFGGWGGVEGRGRTKGGSKRGREKAGWGLGAMPGRTA